MVAKPKNGGPKAVTQQSAGIQGKNISCMVSHSFFACLVSYFSLRQGPIYFLCDVNPKCFFLEPAPVPCSSVFEICVRNGKQNENLALLNCSIH